MKDTSTRHGPADGPDLTGTALTRRRFVAIAAGTVALAACGGAATAPSPTPAPATPAPATPAPATPAPATPAPTATPAPAAVVNVEAYEAGNSFLFKADQLAVPAGKVTFNFKNTGKMMHELFVYPIQDIRSVLGPHRQDKKVDEAAALKGLAAMAEDIDAGKSLSVSGTLVPGFYELACHVRVKQPDGTTVTHFDKGQYLTLAVLGPGGPAASVTTASSTMTVVMKGEETGAWLFVPDRLVVPAGDVTFKVTNSMKMEHDFVVHPIGDVTSLVAFKLQGKHGFDYATLKGAELIGDLPAGKSDSKTMKLTPGYWVAACYIAAKDPDGTSFIHSDRGQRFVFQVK